MNSKILVIILLLCGANTFAQKRIKKLDSINEKTTNMIYHDYSTAVDNSDENKKKATFSAYPYVFYTPESQFAGGAGGIYVFYAGRDSKLRPSKMSFGGYY